MHWINDAENKNIVLRYHDKELNPAKVNCPLCVIAGLLRLTRTRKLHSTGDVAWDLHEYYDRKEITKLGKNEGKKIQHSNIVMADWEVGGYSKSLKLVDAQRAGMIDALKEIYKLAVNSVKLPPEVFVSNKDNFLTGIDLSKMKKVKKHDFFVGYLQIRGHWMNIIVKWAEMKAEFVDYQCHHRDKEINKNFEYRGQPYDSWGSFGKLSNLDLFQETPLVYYNVKSVAKPREPQKPIKTEKPITTEKCITM